MKSQRSAWVLTLLFSVSMSGWSGVASAQNAAGSNSNNDAMLLLLEQNRNLQSEVQALRALVEEQGFQIRRLQRESLDRYTDTDTRLSTLEQGLAGGSGAGVGNGIGSGNGNGIGNGNTTAANQVPAPAIATGQNPAELSPPPDSTIAATATPAPGSIAAADVAGSAAASNSRPTVTSSSPVRRPTAARPSLEPAVLSEQQLYQMAYDSAINSQFERAIAEFDQYLSVYPQGRFITNAHYWKGQSYLYMNRYDEAIAEYAVILERYSDDAKVPDSMYGQAIAYEGMGDTQRARRLLQQILREYPNTGVASLANTRLRSLN